MANSSRPIAPFLPPEIISRILHFTRGYCSMARISRCWRNESQRRLFKSVRISGRKVQPLQVLEAIQEGKGRLIESLHIRLVNVPEGMPAYGQLLMLLHYTPNLQILNIALESRYVGWNGIDDINEMSLTLDLPYLVEATIHSGDKQYSRNLFERILISAPNLVKLALLFWRPYEGSIWITPSFSKLRHLMLRGTSVLESKIFNLASFEGLETLSIYGIRSESTIYVFDLDREDPEVLDSSCMKLFEIVGPTLRELTTSGIAIPQSFYNLLPILDILNAGPLYLPGDDSRTFILPPALSKLSILGFEGATLPLSTLNNLDHLIIRLRNTSYDLSNLSIYLKTLTISDMLVDELLKSLEHIRVGQFPVQKLILGSGFLYNPDTADYEVEFREEDCDLAEIEAIKNRCTALGINMVNQYNPPLNCCDDPEL